MLAWLIRFAASLYPAWWRARYGSEFAALLDEMEPRAGTMLDTLKGALLMQFNRLDLARSAAGCVLIGTSVAALLFVAAPRPFASSLSIEIHAAGDADWTEIAVQEALGFTDANLARVIETVGLYPDDRRNGPAADVLDRFRRDISVTLSAPVAGQSPSASHTSAGAPVRDLGRLNLSFIHADGPTAEKVVTALGQLVVVENLRRGQRAAQQPDRGASLRVRIARPAHHDRADPNLMVVMGTGLGAAALAAAGLFALRRRPQPRH
jgi:hypothetical protein